MKKIAADENYKAFKELNKYDASMQKVSNESENYKAFKELNKYDEVAKLREELEILKRKIKKLEKAEVVSRNKIERHHPAPLQ